MCRGNSTRRGDKTVTKETAPIRLDGDEDPIAAK